MKILQVSTSRRWIALPLLLALAVPAFAKERAAFSVSSIQNQVTILASDALRGRGTGDIGNDKAAQLIAEEFARYGLKPIGTRRQKDLEAALDGSGYYQPFTVSGGRSAGRNSRLEVRSGDHTVNYRSRTEFEPAGISAPGAAEGGIVFVGYGISDRDENHDDYANNLDVKGKVVLLFDGIPNYKSGKAFERYRYLFNKAFIAREKGAVAVLAIRNRDSNTPSSSFNQPSDAGLPVLSVRYPMAERWLAAQNIKIEDVQRDADAGKNVSTTLQASARIQADVQKVTKTTANIVGMIEGSDPSLKNEYVIVGAHMDHLGFGGADSMDRSGKPTIHHGADDNASGTTGVLQLAARFGPKSGSDTPRLKRSLILMCFSGEEMGLLGSVHYTRKPIFPLEKTVAMLNMDMIGRLKDNSLTIGGVPSAKEWEALLKAANRDTYLTLQVDTARPNEAFGASDHYSFYQKDIPVLFFFTGLHADYHRPSDTADKINTAGMARILELVTHCVEGVADAPSRPTFAKLPAPSTPSMSSRGFPVSIGIMPDYAAGEEGVLVGDVIPGRPAEKVGMKKGDLIVKFGDVNVKSVQDYTAALQNHKPGEVVDIVVKRGNETLTFKITLAAPTRR